MQQQLGELETARASLQRALEINEAVYGREHPEVASTLGNIGTVQQQLGELETACQTQKHALAIFERFTDPGSDLPLSLVPDDVLDDVAMRREI